MDAIRVSTVENVVLERFVPPSEEDDIPQRTRLTGTLHIVRHHLFFSPNSSSSTTEEIWIPYPSINSLTRMSPSSDGLYPLNLRTRNFDTYIFYFEKERVGGAEDVWQSVRDCAVVSTVEQLYAFFYRLPEQPHANISTTESKTGSSTSPLSLSPERVTTPISSKSRQNGWESFNPRTEFSRQGVGVRTKAWRFTDINKDYSFSPTYPAKLVVPSRISDNVLSYAGKYRSKARIPALTYLHWANHASITRSSQPMVGLKNSRSAQDEKLVECIFTTHLSTESAYVQSSDPLSPVTSSQSLPQVYGATATNLIIDARPTTNAMANVAMGAGTENMENYKSGRKAYLGIDNIHVMRNSLKAIDGAIRLSEEIGEPLDKMVLRKSNWLRHISTLLDGALVIIKNIHLNASHVLLHCSDGWDRTSQLSASAQICLDPYYRTVEGFKVLVEKDWLAFGHKFLDRSGHLSSEKLFTVAEAHGGGDDESDDEFGGAQKAAQAFFASMQKQFQSSSHLKEVSPVFHQFLDCIWQLQRQFPDRFEYNEQFLLDLHEYLYSCQFGTFLFNHEQQRRTSRPAQDGESGGSYVERTVPVWEFIERVEETNYINDKYNAKLDDKESREVTSDQGVLLPDPKDVKFWFKLFKRGDNEMNLNKVPQQQAQGVDKLEVAPGQIDPVSIEALSGVDAQTGHLEIPRGPARTPSPAMSASPSAWDTNNSSSQAYTRSPEMSPQRAAAGRGWNWGQISTGAFNALQKGARDIRTIGQEAITQLRAEAGQVDGEMWSKSDREARSQSYAPGTGIGEGRLGRRISDLEKPKYNVRLPSESNPWATTPRAEQAPAADTTSVAQESTSMFNNARADGPRPNVGKPRESVSTNPWKDPPTSSLSDLTLNDKPDGPSSARSKVEQKASLPNTVNVNNGDDDIPAALGGDRKAWDPLGAA